MRKKAACFLLALLFPWSLSAQEQTPAKAKPLALTHVTIIDPSGAPVRADMSIIIAGGRIQALGRSRRLRLPKTATVIDAAGKFLIPGLWDMHTHIGNGEFDRSGYLRLFLANGVTGIRVMRGELAHYRWREEIAGARLIGPRMIVASREIDEARTTPQQARQAIGKARQEGADFFKVHDRLPAESYFALMDEARRLGMRVEGHVPASITAVQAAIAGQKSLEHFNGLDEAKAHPSKAAALAAVFKQHQTWLCPTLIMRNNYAVLDDQQMASDNRLKYVESAWQKRWVRMVNESGNGPAGEWAKRKETVQKEKALVGLMHKAGVNILAGTDNANPFCFPGFSLHEELVMLVDSGLTPLQALQTATLNPAKFLNQQHLFGTVEPGKLADLVLLDADPLTDIHNTRKIRAVIVNGRFFCREQLDRILSEIESAAKK
jgi:imidazolonepropionase-like amidohydrolase